MATNDIKRMSIKEFRDKGFLQEANRLFFHPLGLALEIVVDFPEGTPQEVIDKYENVMDYPDAVWSLGGIWDYREDPEGMLFGEGMIDPEKIKRIADLYHAKVAVRCNMKECDALGLQKPTTKPEKPKDTSNG